MFATVHLALLASRVRPLAASSTRLLPVLPAFGALLPGGGLQRGTVVRCTGKKESAARSLALALVAGASATGSWCGVVGMDDVGALAASEYGIRLDHLVITRAAPASWGVSVATLLEGLDIVLFAPPSSPRPALMRELAARTRARGAVLVVAEERPSSRADLELAVEEACWRGLAEGAGRLQSRRVTVVARGRGSAARPLRRELWLPTASGTVAAA